jgi:hypothetical protein
MLAGCYRPARPDCAVSCAGGAPCPNGLTCGASDQLCHAGAIECSALEVPPIADAAPASDAGPGSDAAPGRDGGGTGTYCAPQQGLIGCYEFENTANNALDGLDITVNGNVQFPSDGEVGHAAAFNNTTTASIAVDPRLDLSAFTLEAWVNPSQFGGDNTSLVNRYFHYAMVLDAKGEPVCEYTASGGALAFAATIVPLALDHWSHVACTFDGMNLRTYVNGLNPASTNTTAGPVATGGMEGVSIGGAAPDHANDFYIGQLDELRIFSRVRTAQEICMDAGLASCM